jgi:hypothetical protein
LVSCINLVLPPGWCCIFEVCAASCENKTAESNAPTCCGHCKVATGAQASHEAESQPPPPDPVAPGECPCTERQTTLTHVFKISVHDLYPAVQFVAFDAVPGWTGTTQLFDVLTFRPDHSLQIIYCAWLC